jgi:hypothetical protein
VEGIALPPVGVEVPLYRDPLEELEDGLVGQRLLPVTGTMGVPALLIGVEVPMAPEGLVLIGVEVPEAPLVPTAEGVSPPVTGTTVPVLETAGVVVPELTPEVGASVERPRLGVSWPVLGITGEPVASGF